MASDNALRTTINSKDDVQKHPQSAWELIRRLRSMLEKAQEGQEKAEGEARRLREEQEYDNEAP
jgi:hypothetical protein